MRLVEEGSIASGTLLRLVRFLATAWNARYAFVAALSQPEAGAGLRRVTFWLAKNHGLCTGLGPRDLAQDLTAPSTPYDWGRALCQIWPEEPELAGLTAPQCVTVPLLGDGGRLLGHLGVLGPGQTSRVDRDLPPLARLAAPEVESWIQGRT